MPTMRCGKGIKGLPKQWTNWNQRGCTGGRGGRKGECKVSREEGRRPNPEGCDLGSRVRSVATIAPMQMRRGRGFKGVPEEVFDEVEEREEVCKRC